MNNSPEKNRKYNLLFISPETKKSTVGTITPSGRASFQLLKPISPQY